MPKDCQSGQCALKPKDSEKSALPYLLRSVACFTALRTAGKNGFAFCRISGVPAGDLVQMAEAANADVGQIVQTAIPDTGRSRKLGSHA
jgi:hypothetical protein